jgi:type IV secretory pathway VirB4 component
VSLVDEIDRLLGGTPPSAHGPSLHEASEAQVPDPDFPNAYDESSAAFKKSPRILAYIDWILGGPRPDGADSSRTDQPQEDAITKASRPNSDSPRRPAHSAGPAAAVEMEAALHIGTRELVDHLAPGAMHVYPDCIELVGEAWVRIWFIEDYPPVMGRGSLDSLYNFPAEIRHAMQVLPLDKAAVREQLRQRRTSLHAEILTRQKQGRLADFNAQDELAETEKTLYELESTHLPPQELLWTIALYARTDQELDELSRRLEDYLLDADLRAHRASLRQEDALHTVQPYGVNFLGHGRNISTLSLGGMFPFARRLQVDLDGIPYGIDRSTGAWAIINDFAQPNSNLLVIGEQGSGKSMFLKYKATWAVLLGMRVYVLDLEGEFEEMCRALGGAYLDMALSSPHSMNILDLNPFDEDAMFNGLQDTLAWLEIALGKLTPKERNVILIPAYERVMQAAGILKDRPATWKKIPPVLSDLYLVLRSEVNPLSQDLADRLETLAMGMYSSAFSAHTNINAQASLVVFGLKNVHPDMQALRMRQIQTFIWSNVLAKEMPTLVVVDEAWRWLLHASAANDLSEMARRFRKRNAGIHLATQHGADLSASSGAVVIRDTAAITLLFRQNASAVPPLQGLFGLNEVEARELLTLDSGESILLMGGNHIPLFTVIPPKWYPLWTTRPSDKLKPA